MMQVQKHKRGYAFSFKPSVLANEERVVTAMDVDPSKEVSVVAGMLAQSQSITGNYPEELLTDGGYFCNEIIQLTLQHDISLLSSEKALNPRAKKSKRFPKSDFNYIESKNIYVCPAGAELTTNKRKGKGDTYSTPACEGCELRPQCTTAKLGRRIKREPEDKEKELLREVMRHPQAKKIHKKRMAMVEPVYSILRLKQGLNRFRRKGLKGVKLEFALHILSYNASRYIAKALKSHYIAYIMWRCNVRLLQWPKRRECRPDWQLSLR